MSPTLTVAQISGAGGARFVDGGRPGYRHLAIPRGGAADRGSAAAGNRLLGQAPQHPCLELTLSGGRWRLSGRGSLALTGADMGWTLNGEPVGRYETVALDGEYALRGGVAWRGCRGYLCLKGDWQLPRVLGSVEGGLPGTVQPRPGCRFTVTADAVQAVHQGGQLPPHPAGEVVVSVVPGPEWEWLGCGAREFMLNTSFRVGTASDRQGIRLESHRRHDNLLPPLLSSPVLPGTVQWTPSGPILLGPDAQTVGGYPRVLLATPLPDAVFQLRPGEVVRFSLLTTGPLR